MNALSGKDGHPLWFWSRDLPPDRYGYAWPLLWWGCGPDGWPLLAVPLSGLTPEDMSLNMNPDYLLRPVVHMLEGSTGRELHAALGLYRPRVADLDGDGIDDIWGEVDGQLRAFRGQAPEAWRAPRSVRAGRRIAAFSRQRPGRRRHRGCPDRPGAYLRWFVAAPDGQPHGHRPLRHDGHVLWKSVLDPPGIWFDRDRGDSYEFSTFPMPAGDLDSDGMPDVLVKRDVSRFSQAAIERPAALPLQALSGRTGRFLWSAGPLHLGFAARGFSWIHWQCRPEARVIEPGGTTDIVVRHCNPFVKPSGPPVAFPNGQDRLARISGRDGRIVWDIPLISPTDRTSAVTSDGPHPFQFGDLDGDGSLDVVIVIPPSPADGRTVIELKAVSLDDGKPIWVHRLRYDHTEMFKAQVVVGDLDGDGRAEVLVDNRVPDAIPPRPMLEALDGRDGQVLWTWRPVYPDSHAISWSPPYLITDLDGDGRREIGLVLYGGDKQSRDLLLDARGREVVRRELPEGNHWGWTLNAADLDGDGRDELLVIGKRLLVLGPGLKEIWSRPSLDNPLGVRSLSASSGRPAAVIVSPWLGLAGTDGRPLWAGQSPTWGVPRLGLIDAGDSTRLPLWAELAPGATVCRSALPVTPAGRPAPPVGLPVRPGLARDDPRGPAPCPGPTRS